MLKFLRKLSAVQLWGIVLAVVAAFAAGETLLEKEDPTVSINYTPTEELSQETETVAHVSEEVYVVREHKDIIGVFQSGSSNPVLTVQVRVDSLPEEDRLLLTEGVGFDNYGDMVAFLENYE